MNWLRKLLWGQATFRISGAAPQEVLNALMAANIVFWDIVREDELNYTLSLFPKDQEKVETLALRVYCKAELLSVKSLKRQGERFKRRPVFLLAMAAALFCSFFLQSYVWVLDVKGTDKLHEKEILRALEEEGVVFGAWGRSVDSQELRLKILSRLPQVSWLAVNRKGGKLTILLTEKEEIPREGEYTPGNLVALRSGVVTDYTICDGMRLVKRGETVKEGQLLVSGLEDYGIYVKAVCAQGEVYAQTWHAARLLKPSFRQQKEYTGKEWTQISVILGNKRINLYGNSGIFYTTCDKMISKKKLSIPGYEFPMTIEQVTYREYRLIEQPVQEQTAKKALLQSWKNLVCSQMVAGELLRTEASICRFEQFYLLDAESTCREMIAKWMPLQEIYEGE